MKRIFYPGTFYLPNKDTDYSKWSVISCDQHTSNIEYWNNVKELVKNSPSSLNLILPEAYIHLDSEYSIEDIYKYMDEYLKNETIIPVIENGLIIVERETSTGKRIGLLGTIDLEEYSFKDNDHLIVATEDYVENRLKVRIKIRENALLELSHAIVFIKDNENLIEKVYKKCQKNKPIYDFNLMFNSSRIRGFKVSKEDSSLLLESINNIDNEHDPIMMVGDGNHSLASAKICWENYKQNNPDYNPNHPLRYAMVELEPLSSDSIQFYPIHRFVYDVPFSNLYNEFSDYLDKNHIKNVGNHIITLKSKDDIEVFNFKSTIDSIKILQDFLDMYHISNGYNVDYIHDEKEIKRLIKNNKGTAIIVEAIDKEELFDWVKMNGHLPKKTFSIGTSSEKRYYLEARIIKENI